MILGTDPAAYISAFTPILLLILLPLVRYVIKSALRSEIEITVSPQLVAINHRIDNHMAREERDLQRIGDERERVHDRLTRIESRLQAIEQRSYDRRRED